MSPWWVRPGLDVAEGRLRIAGRDVEALAREHGTPLFVYDRVRFAENARELQGALARTGLPYRVRFALKANPLPEVLEIFRALGAPGEPASVGIDACSPGEVERAIECGWRADEISYTGTNVSERDLDALLPMGVHLNLDAISQIERYGRRAAGTAIGIRIDPGVGAGYNHHLEYAGDHPTKFGIGLERLDEAVAMARRHDLTIDTVHFHAGSGWPGLRSARVRRCTRRRRRGGHATPSGRLSDRRGQRGRRARPAGTARRAARRSRRLRGRPRAHLGPLGVTVVCEPGDYLAKDAAILVGEVVTVEQRRGVTFVGLDSAGTSTARTSSTSSRRSWSCAGRPTRRGPSSTPAAISRR